MTDETRERARDLLYSLTYETTVERVAAELARVAAELARLEAERDEARGALARSEEARRVAVEALRDLLDDMGIEQDDPRISYVTVQLSRESIAEARAALDAQPEEPSE